MSSISREVRTNSKEISGGVIVFSGGADGRKYLLLRHANGGHWSFPKGHLEERESAREAAVRELEEETGLLPEDFLADFRERVHYSYRRKGERIEKAVVYFLASVEGIDPVTLSDEHLDYGWFSFKEAEEKLTYDNDREILRKAEAGLGSHGS